MGRRLILATVATLLAGSALAQTPPRHLTAALADAGRPAADKARDAVRKPAEMLAFAEVQPGDKVADMIMGGGYFTRVLAKAVGDEGRVYAYQPAEFVAYRAAYGEEQKAVAGAYKNVTPLTQSLGAFDLPDGLDLVFTVQNYHDLYLSAMPKGVAEKVNAEVFKSLKPGGVYLVSDHSAAAGSGLRDANSLHRIDKEQVKKEVAAAGFRFEGESPVLADASDPRTANVFTPALRGKTDQFTLKFRKPG